MTKVQYFLEIPLILTIIPIFALKRPLIGNNKSFYEYKY